MPRYFFHVQDESAHVDDVGVTLPDLVSARAEGLVFAGGLIRDAGLRKRLGDDWCIQVTDDSGLILFRMNFIVATSGSAVQGATRRSG